MKITPEVVRKLLDYDSKSGEMIWRERPNEMFASTSSAKSWNIRYSGVLAGNETVTGKAGIHYIIIRLFGRNYRAHRIAWAHWYGYFPVGLIDRIDGDGTNNRINNLRYVSNGENCRNSRLYRRNTSGICGVSFSGNTSKWRASIQKDGQRDSLGSFDSLFEAACARKSAELRLGFSERHGKRAT